MSTTDGAGLPAVIERLLEAWNERDPDAMATCFAPDYDSRQPAHPDRAFHGPEQVRKNWTAIYDATPDLEMRLLRWALGDDAVWLEVADSGRSRVDGQPVELVGALILGLANDCIAWARIYFEPVEHGAGIEAAVQEIVRAQPPD